jgi:hypothetical protein
MDNVQKPRNSDSFYRYDYSFQDSDWQQSSTANWEGEIFLLTSSVCNGYRIHSASCPLGTGIYPPQQHKDDHSFILYLSNEHVE